MLRILVVEDEPPILRSIVAAVHACGEEYRVADTAYNGKSALEKIRAAVPPFDLVLTDVRMPVMDGLALAETIHETEPELFCAVISGYNDFAFVQGALRSQVYDYLMKPVSPEALERCLAGIHDIVRRREAEKREKRLMEAVRTPHVRQPEAAPAGDGGEMYAPFLICVGAFPLIADDALLPGAQLWSMVDLNAICQAILPSGEKATVLDGKTASEKIIFVETTEKLHCKDIAYGLFDAFEKRGLYANIVYPSHVCGFARLGEVLGGMRVRLQNGARFLNLSVMRDIEAVSLPVVGEEYGKTLAEALYTLDRDKLSAAVEETVAHMIALEVSQAQASHYFKELVSVNRKRFGISEEKLQAYLYDVDYSISNALTPQGFCENMAYILYETVRAIPPHSEAEAEPPVIAKIEEYLKEHFTEDMTNARLAQVFGFVPSYLSRLFRTWRGVSPSEYLMKYRIRTAISLMESDSMMLVKEAAARVGLKDPYYFSKVFKKEMGVSPSEYFGR